MTHDEFSQQFKARLARLDKAQPIRQPNPQPIRPVVDLTGTIVTGCLGE